MLLPLAISHQGCFPFLWLSEKSKQQCRDMLCRGMVSSAFEFAEMCRAVDYHNFLFSMKASNPLVMVQAYRLLAAEQYAKGWDYPLHLG